MTDPTPDDAPRQVSAEAIRFLALIGRDDDELRFRALPDDPAKKGNAPPIDVVGTFAEKAQKLRKLNDAGYGIFVQVNRSDGQGRAAANMVSAPCYFADFDGTPLDNVARLGLAPHVEVETSTGKRHFYWRVDDIPIDLFSQVQGRLITLFESDKSIKDLPRILRLPGFEHKKDPANPQLVRVVAAMDAPPYGREEFMTALEAAEKARGLGRKKPAAAQNPRPTAAATAELVRVESALRHLIGTGAYDIADRETWAIKIAIPLKAYLDDGFDLFLRLSREDDSFDSEDACRKHWNSIKDDRGDGARLTVGSIFHDAKAAGWVAPPSPIDPFDPTNDPPERGAGGKAGKPDPAAIIVQQALDAEDDHFLDPNGVHFVRYLRTVGDRENWVTIKPESAEYERVVKLRFFAAGADVKVAPAEQVNAAIQLMMARAETSDVRHPVFIRVGDYEGQVYLDLDRGDGQVVEIDKEDWRIVQNPPVRFVRGSRGPMPLPERGGTLDLFGKHFPTGSVDDLRRVIGFMIGALSPLGAFPIALLVGEAGSTKSNFGDKITALVDPPAAAPKAARFSMSTEERNLHIAASNCRLMQVDNMSSLRADEADQLCRLSTGAASSYRKMRTDADQQVFFIVRPLVVTAITVPSNRTDLISRSLQIAIPRVGRRLTEERVWRDFNADKGKMLGFLLSAIAMALRNKEAVHAMVEADAFPLPRMADFALFIEGAAEMLGLAPGGFSSLLNEEQAALQRDAVQGDPLVEALVGYFSRPGAEPIRATGRGLRDMLMASGSAVELPAHNQIGARLTRIAQGLRNSGIEHVETTDTHRKVKVFTITTTADFVPAQVSGGGQVGQRHQVSDGDDKALPF